MSCTSCALFDNVRSRYYNRSGKDNGEFNKSYDIMGAIMWTLGSILVSCNVELSANHSGILFSATLHNVLLMLLATLFLGKGLKDSNSFFVLPWIIISVWSMYQIQCRDIVKFYKALVILQTPNKLPWLSLFTYAVALAARLHLTLSVANLAMQQWYNKKLSQEVLKSSKHL